MKKTLVTIVGPTAIGKTSLAISLAQHYKTEIISADSRQFFKEMNLGTAVPSKEELQLVKHHFIQHKSIAEHYSVGDFERDCLNTLGNIFEKHDLAFMVGGRGLYVNAVLYGLNNFPEIDKKIRTALNKQLKEEGIISLQKQLEKLDSVYFRKVDRQNPQRLIRALEICLGTGSTYSSFLTPKNAIRPFESIVIGISATRATIYKRINSRVDTMIKAGLLKEVKSLLASRELNAMQTVGYKEIYRYLDGEYDWEMAIEEIKKNTRRFAKRQLTWFNKDQNIIWFDHESTLISIIKKIDSKLTLEQ